MEEMKQSNTVIPNQKVNPEQPPNNDTLLQ